MKDMLKKLETADEPLLYEYFIKIGKEIPFYFPVSYDLWHKCMFNDITEEGLPLFNELETYLYYENDTLKGFIQFGLSSFIFSENGKDFKNRYAIIRNIHYSKNSKNPNQIIEIALNYFNDKNIREIHAFFHYFGMSCYARHGKLHDSAFYIEDLLYRHSFKKEHENVYFSKDLGKEKYYSDPEIGYEIHDNGDKTKIDFFVNNERIGYCELAYLYGNISYLYYIEIQKEYRHKGWGTKCVNIIFHILNERQIIKLDLDTIDTNTIAQRFYGKIGFINKGITRSYRIEK
jgi:ribosomal protein S18 acetylase RimI-like enzyme